MLADDIERQKRAGKRQKLLPMTKTGEIGTQLGGFLRVAGEAGVSFVQKHGHVTKMNMLEIPVERRSSKGQLLVSVLLDDVVVSAGLSAET